MLKYKLRKKNKCLVYLGEKLKLPNLFVHINIKLLFQIRHKKNLFE